MHLFSSAQHQNGIVRLHAYSAVQQRGNVPIDTNGNPVYLQTDTLYRIYVESKQLKDTVRWKTAWLDGRVYSVITAFDERKVIEIGSSTSNNQKIIIRVPEKNILSLLRLIPANIKMNPPQRIKSGEILLSGIYKKKTMFLKIDSIIPLQLPAVQ